MKIAIGLTFFVVAGIASATPVSPATRADLSPATTNACLKRQLTEPANAGIHPAKIHQYCNCVGEETVNQMTQEAADYVERTGDPKPLLNATMYAYKACVPSLV
ncbi:hypothetical protein [Stenotrophomonas panacihumi]|uniref:hypothetical protein n=1 Tax=Stenotrophomonas panacihumi TaxID=676599 RepID=UPI0011B247B3|nr:hypothetical protein [Stenotrophomonas panacihumi]